MLKLSKEPTESKWVQLRLRKLPDSSFQFEIEDVRAAKELARRFNWTLKATPLGRFLGCLAELVVKFELTDLKLQHDFKNPDELQDRSDFRLTAKYGSDIWLEVKSCPHYGDSIIIEGEKTEFDYIIGVKILRGNKKAIIAGYLPMKEVVESFPFYQVGEHSRITTTPGRPIPLSELRLIGELWENLQDRTKKGGEP